MFKFSKFAFKYFYNERLEVLARRNIQMETCNIIYDIIIDKAILAILYISIIIDKAIFAQNKMHLQST